MFPNEIVMKKGKVSPTFGDYKLVVNQIAESIEKLKRKPFSRQNQMITWVPYLDREVYDPPCLQRIWFRLDQEKEGFCLNVNISFRSNDAWNAFFMNCFGLTMFINDNILKEAQKAYRSTIRFGRINWMADSFHIYGKDRINFENTFVKKLATENFANRTMNFWDKDIQAYYHESEKMILEKIKSYKT
jgi:thymidylate synthase